MARRSAGTRAAKGVRGLTAGLKRSMVGSSLTAAEAKILRVSLPRTGQTSRQLSSRRRAVTSANRRTLLGAAVTESELNRLIKRLPRRGAKRRR